jgi:hypothetical protein
MTVSGETMTTLDLSIPAHRLPGWVWWLAIALFVIPLLPFAVRYGFLAVLVGGLWQIPVVLVLIVAHEAVHAIGWKFAGGLPWSKFKFGIVWKALAPYCHATVPMNVNAYRIGAVMPLIVTGIVPLVLAYIAGDAGWTFISAVMISAAVGDIYVLWTLRDMPSNALIQDHPSQVGCIAYLP